MNELVQLLISNVGVDQKQAEGGLGTILNFAKEQLSGGDFSQITNLIDGADTLMGSAPSADAQSSGLGGMLGAVTSALGVNAGGLAGLATLVGKLDGLGIDMDTVTKFMPVISEFLESKGGETAKGIFNNLIK